MFPNRPSLKSLVLKGSMWTIVGYGSGQMIRLLRSLILTRLLFPEAFGLMSLVWVVMFGLEMLSDTGVGSSIMRDKRGDDPDFLNTAWTFQVIRGALLWAMACLIAYPMSALYGAPDLVQLIPVAGLTALIAGFGSTAFFTCRRRMEFGRLVVLDLCNEVVSLVAIILWALAYPTVWALVGGALIGRSFLVVASHFFLPGIRNRFRWETSSFQVLFHFGKWIFFSSAFSFLGSQADRLILGRYLDMAHLGTYSIAVMLSEAVYALMIKLNHGVLFPAYGNIHQNEPHRLRSVIYSARLGIDLLLIFPIAALMMLGNRVVGLLYDTRYHEAGWMFQILCARLLMVAVNSNSEACLVALGRPQYAVAQNFCRALWIIAGIPIGWNLMEMKGAIWAVALSEIPVAIVLWVGLARHHMLLLSYEFRSLLFVGLGAGFGYGLLRFLP